jgi:hypothetical protein
VAKLLVECAPNHRDALLTALDQELDRWFLSDTSNPAMLCTLNGGAGHSSFQLSHLAAVKLHEHRIECLDTAIGVRAWMTLQVWSGCCQGAAGAGQRPLQQSGRPGGVAGAQAPANPHCNLQSHYG